MAPRSISSKQVAAQSSRPIHPPFPRLSLLLLPSTPDPTGIYIVRTISTSFLSQSDPLLTISKCPSSFLLLTSHGERPIAPEFQTSSPVPWYSPFVLCISWYHASFGRLVTPPRQLRLIAAAHSPVLRPVLGRASCGSRCSF